MDAHAHIRRNETMLHGLSIAVLLLALGGVLPELLAMGIAIASSGTAGLRTLARHREAAQRRRSADALLAAIPGLRVPDRLRWRAGELTSPEHRRRTAAELHRFARMADEPILRTSVPVYLSTLRPNHDRLESMA